MKKAYPQGLKPLFDSWQRGPRLKALAYLEATAKTLAYLESQRASRRNRLVLLQRCLMSFTECDCGSYK